MIARETHFEQNMRPADASLSFHLLGPSDYGACARLQDQIGLQFACQEGPKASILVSEHASLITVGRRGSRRHIHRTDDGGEAPAVRWVTRTGGCVAHGPGQIAVYALVMPQEWGWTISEFRRRICDAATRMLADWGLSVRYSDPESGIWGRGGGVLAFGWGQRQGLAHHGFYLNVHPVETPTTLVDFVPPDERPLGCSARMSSLLAELRQPVRMPEVRAALLPALASALRCDRYHVFTGHPLLTRAMV